MWDQIMDHWPAIEADADGRCWPANLRQDMPRSRGDLSSVEAVVEFTVFGRDDRHKHGQTSSSDWLLEYKELFAHMVNVHASATVLDPPKAKRLGRRNTVEQCAGCLTPIVPLLQKGSRFNDALYHNGPAGQPWCWHEASRARTGPSVVVGVVVVADP